MPFCPKCRYEYKEGTCTCPDCGIELVGVVSEEDEEGPRTPADSDAFKDRVVIGNLRSWYLAKMTVQGLRAKNIPAVVLSYSGFFGQLEFTGFSGFRSMGAYSLLVPMEYVADADKEAETILGDVWDDART